MKKINYYIPIIVVVLGCNQSHTDVQKPKDFGDKIEALVLEENNIGQEYGFKINNKNETLEYTVTYLGSLSKSKNKILHTGILSGNKDSPHYNAYLVIYSQNNKRIGKYYIGSNDSLKLSNDTLIIEGFADCDQTTQISFRDSIPKQIFIKCREDKEHIFGDIYGFETEEEIEKQR